MHNTQAERLRRDSKELSHYIQKLKKEGDQSKVYKMIKKREYIESQLTEIQEYFH